MSSTPNSFLPPLVCSAADLRRAVAEARRAGQSIGLVPTMGALHEGHLSLVDASRRACGFTVVSIFVNPTQFGPGEDFSRYPRTLEADLKLLTGHGVALVYAPSNDSIYRERHATYVEMGGAAVPLEGQFRPNHFRGVATIVLKLFNLVQPDRAFFGRKDYQQSLVVRRMVEDLDLPIRVEICPTIREPDGLALSSRNRFLSPDERQRALAISQSLRSARQLIEQGATDGAAITSQMQKLLHAADLKIDYALLADPETLEPIATVSGPVVAIVAARVGPTRLIDNELIG